jgi:NTP pyrophosphatase (non-canonical NTP hydrolase)
MSAPARSEAQQLVRETMLAAGGYWRPLAAVARLLEELGELSELAQTGGERRQIAGELADLWIITTALADQFLISLPEPPSGGESQADLATLLGAAGPIARVVNHYDGPKVPRAGQPLPTLHGAIAGFHDALGGFAAAHGIDLAAAVREKIGQIHARGDIERFEPAGLDPSTAPVLARACAAGQERRLWGAPDPGPGPVTAARRAELARPALRMFAKAARAEELEGFVIAGPPSAAAERGAWLRALVAELDPHGTPERFELAGAGLRASVLETPGGTLALVYAED